MIEIAEKLTLQGNCVLMPNELTRPKKEAHTEQEAKIIDQKRKNKTLGCYIRSKCRWFYRKQYKK